MSNLFRTTSGMATGTVMHLLDFSKHPMVSVCGIDPGPLQQIFRDWCRLGTYMRRHTDIDYRNMNTVCPDCEDILPIYLLSNDYAD